MVAQEKASELQRKFELLGILRMGHFVLHSGKHSNYKLDLDCVEEGTELFWEICDIIAEGFLNPRINAVVGVPNGGTRLARGVATLLNRKSIGGRSVRAVPAFKGGGDSILVTPVEGEILCALVVEDVATTGDSAAQTRVAIEAVGGRVIGTVAVILRNVSSLRQQEDVGGLLQWRGEVQGNLYECDASECPSCNLQE